MSGNMRSWICAAAAAAVVVPVLAAGPVEIKLATFAPANSKWHLELTDLADTWKKVTEGRVTLTVYPGGNQGTEESVIKKMNPVAGQLQAALLLEPGLAEIDQAFNVFAIPFFFESDAEYRSIQQALTPILTARLEQKKFHLVNWGHAGWIQIFSKKPIRSLAELKAAKLFTSEGDTRMVQWYKANGFNPQALPFNDIAAQLRLPTGLIDTAPSPPYGALVLRYFENAPYMLDVSVAPLVGATIVTDDAWKRISDADRTKMLAAARGMEDRVLGGAPKLDADSIAAMEKRGLKVQKLTPAAAAEFRAAADTLTATMRGGMVPADVFDAAMAARTAFRKTKKPS